MEPTFVDTTTAMASMVDALLDLQDLGPLLYVDLEGNNLSRHGTISLLTLLVRPGDITYLVDVTKLGIEAFKTPGGKGTTLQTLLESPTIAKVFFDVRNDSDALFGHFGIRLACVQDIQLMELASRNFSKRCVNGLARCIENDSGLSNRQKMAWKEVKDTGHRLFDPKRGGSYGVFDVRPLSKEVSSYCVQDVAFLPVLRDTYRRKLSQNWIGLVDQETAARIKLSQSPSFNGKGPHMALGPPSWIGWQPKVPANAVVDRNPDQGEPALGALNGKAQQNAEDTEGAVVAGSREERIKNIEPEIRAERSFDGGLGTHGPYSRARSSNDNLASFTLDATTSSPTSIPRGAIRLGGNDSESGDDLLDQDFDDDRYSPNFSEDFGSSQDFTACSANDCGYCGRCEY